MWVAQRDNVPKEKIGKFAKEYDINGVIDKEKVELMTNEFDTWYENNAEFDFGMDIFGRMFGMNYTIPGNYTISEDDDYINEYY